MCESFDYLFLSHQQTAKILSHHSRLRIDVGVPDDETIQADLTLNSISIERAGGTILILVGLCLSQVDIRAVSRSGNPSCARALL